MKVRLTKNKEIIFKIESSVEQPNMEISLELYLKYLDIIESYEEMQNKLKVVYEDVSND